jgi:hypothetical protein
MSKKSAKIVAEIKNKITNSSLFLISGKDLASQDLVINTLFPYEWAQLAAVLHYTRLEMLARYKHSSLSGPFVRYGENEEWYTNKHYSFF